MLNWILQHLLELVFSTILAILSLGLKTAIKMVKEEHEEQERLKEGVLALLHNELYQLAKELIKKNEIDTEEFKNLEYIYESYEALGGNGTGKILFEKCKEIFKEKGVQ